MGRPASLNLKGMASSVWALDGAGTWDTANTAKILIDESLLRVHQDISIFALIDLFQASKTQVIDPHSRMTTTMLLSLGLGTIWLLDNIESLSRDKKSRQQLARSGILNTQSVGLVLLYMYVLGGVDGSADGIGLRLRCWRYESTTIRASGRVRINAQIELFSLPYSYLQMAWPGVDWT